MSNFISCRFYEEKFPKVDEIIMVNVRSIEEMGAYVTLLEYNGIEGMILLSELSRRRIRSINKLIRVGRNEVVVVQRVDEAKGYIDLSKRRVSPEEAEACEERFGRAKTIYSILRNIADNLKIDLEDLYSRTAWVLKRVHGDYYDAFRQAVLDFDGVFAPCNITESERELLKATISRRMALQPQKIRADVEVSCYDEGGVDAIKEALKTGLQVQDLYTDAFADGEIPLKINLIAPPHFVITTTLLDKNKGLERVNHAIEAVRKAITTSGGNFEVLKPARVTNASDDKQLQDMLEGENQGSSSEDEDETEDDAEEND